MSKITNPDLFREGIRDEFNKVLSRKSYAINLEKGLYNCAITIADSKNIMKKWDNPYFVQIYIDRFRTVWNNLKDVKILNKIISGEVKPHELGTMTHQEMCPEKWKELIQSKKDKDENRYDPKTVGNTDIFTCRKCKSKKCSYYQLQTRSADEPMTTFVTCISCGNRWKC